VAGGLGFAVAAAGLLLMANLRPGDDVVTAVVPGFVLTAFGLGATFVTGTTSAFAGSGHEDAGLVSGLVNTGHEIGFALGVAIVSTIAASSLAGGSGSILGFRDAFVAAGVVSALAAIAAVRLLPADRPAMEGHAFAH
jgi:predicted MFS family arabinose efflux permease